MSGKRQAAHFSCSDESDDDDDGKKLKPSAVPTIIDLTDSPLKVDLYEPRKSELDKAREASRLASWRDGRMEELILIRKPNLEYDISNLMRTLRPGGMIDGEVINLWTKHVASNLKPKTKAQNRFLKAGFFNCISHPQYEFSEHGYLDFPLLFDSALIRIFMPICYEGHWSLAAINVKNLTVSFYDSLIIENLHIREFEIIQKWLDTICNTHGTPTRRFRNKKHAIVPKQIESLDCGVFVCMYMAYACIRKRMDFTQSDMDLLRQWISFCIIDIVNTGDYFR